MLSVTVGNNVQRKKVIVKHETKIAEILNTENIEYGRQKITCNGTTLSASDFNRSIGEIVGMDAESCYLLAVVKEDNGTSII